MISRIAAVVLALASFLWNEASAAAETISPADFHSKVVSLYNFEPRALGTADVPVKSAQLDEFWSFVKVNAPQALPLLRAELSDPSNSSFFFYDGAKLLLSLSKDKSDLSIVLRSLRKADLRSVDHTDYLITVHWFARNGFDTRQAALRILDFPDFEAFIPLHALRLGQNYSLIYMLFPTKESVFVGDLAERLEGEATLPSQKSLLLALWYTVTPTGTAAIRSFAERPGASGEAATYARELLSRRAGPSVSFSSPSSLREERMKLMQRPISDEALHEFDSLTRKLLAKQ